MTVQDSTAHYPPEVRGMARSVLTGPGDSPAPLRQAVEARAARLAGADREDLAVPAELETYVDKVALYAYKVTDDDVARLRASGYSQDAIFELTISAALGAALARLEKGLTVLSGDH